MARNLARPEERFWSKVVQQDDCWVWTAAILRNGYGYFGIGQKRTVLAHRWAYEHMVALIPDGLVIDHLCRNRACVNPYHLDPVPQSVNVRRGVGPALLKARRSGITHCLCGHILDEWNTRVDKRGRRSCKECHRAQDREKKRRLRANKGGEA